MPDDTQYASPKARKAVEGTISLLSYLGCPDQAAIVSGLLNEAIDWRGKFFDADLSVCSVRNARKFLNEQGVPQAAFFDDHVANAIVQRNRMQELVEALTQKVDELWDPVSQDERGEKIKFMAHVTDTLAEYGHVKQAENGQAEARGIQAPPSGGS